MEDLLVVIAFLVVVAFGGVFIARYRYAIEDFINGVDRDSHDEKLNELRKTYRVAKAELRKYERICRLKAEIADAEKEMTEIRAELTSPYQYKTKKEKK